MTREARDAEICRLHSLGSNTEVIGHAVGLSRQRIQQILRKHGLSKNSRAETDRDEFLGVNLSESVKVALRQEAKRRGISMSLLTSEMLEEMLKEVGSVDPV